MIIFFKIIVENSVEDRVPELPPSKLAKVKKTWSPLKSLCRDHRSSGFKCSF